MRRRTLVVAIAIAVSQVLTPNLFADTNETMLVRVAVKSRTVLQSLQEQGFDIISMGKDGMVDIVVDEKQRGELSRLGFEVTVVATPSTTSATTLTDGLGLYHTYTEMETELNNLVSTYPTLASLQIIGTSIESRNIYALKVSDNVGTDETEPEVLIMGNTHAREIMTVEIPLRFAMYLLSNYGSDATVTSLVDSREIYFIPMINPDGHVYVENTHQSLSWPNWWRKNRRDNLDSSFGVDLNRNFGYQWGYDNIGSSPVTSNDLYRGTGPFSEPETQTIRDFCNSRNFTIGFSYHSYGELLLYPWGYYFGYTDDHNVFAALGDTLTDTNGYLPGNAATGAIYTTNGGSDDWAYGEDGTKPSFFLFTPEVNSSFHGGFGPSDTWIQPTFDLLLDMNMTILHLADNPYRVVGPYTPALATPDHVGLTWPDYRLTWTGAQGGDPNPPVSYEVVEYKNVGTVPQDGANVASPLWKFGGGFAVSTSRAQEGTGSYYSGAINENSAWFEAETFYRVRAGTETFSSWVWYDIEANWDYAYFQVSLNSGLTWASVAGNLTTTSNPNGNNIGHGITGASAGWTLATFSLAAYMGQDVLIRWNYITDQSVLNEGIYVDLPGPVPTHEGLSIVAAGSMTTSLVLTPTTTGTFTYVVRAKDAENDYSGWSNSEDEEVTTSTAVRDDPPQLATELGRNYPNPFNPITTIPYTVGHETGPGVVTLRIYDAGGRLVRTLVDGPVAPGAYRATWQGRNDIGMPVSSGIYFSRLTANGRVLSQKLVFLK